MRLSTRARYALRMMLCLAKNDGLDQPVSLATVAEQTGISRGYLEQLALALRSARLVRGVAGRYGGYRLVKPPSEITIGEVFEATIGPVNLVECVEEPATCLASPDCECRVVYTMINNRISQVLSEFTVGDMMRSEWLSRLDDSAAPRGARIPSWSGGGRGGILRPDLGGCPVQEEPDDL